MKEVISAAVLAAAAACALALGGCWVVATGAGAEAGYVTAQEDRSVSQTMTDQRIVTEVKTKLIADNELPGLHINVDSFKGHVTLHGTVQAASQVDRAITIAESVGGVTNVTSDLKVES
jgi:hyperosmotically inducible protein